MHFPRYWTTKPDNARGGGKDASKFDSSFHAK